MAFILCVPILTKSNDVIGVLELGRKIREFKFSEEDEEIVRSYLSWATVAMDCSNIHAENKQLHLLFDTFHSITRYMQSIKLCTNTIHCTLCNRKVIGEDWNFESIFKCIRVSLQYSVGMYYLFSIASSLQSVS